MIIYEKLLRFFADSSRRLRSALRRRADRAWNRKHPRAFCASFARQCVSDAHDAIDAARVTLRSEWISRASAQPRRSEAFGAAPDELLPNAGDGGGGPEDLDPEGPE